MLFLQFTFVVIHRWYSKKWDHRSCPGTIAVKNWAILARHSQIWHKACSYSFDFKLLKSSALFMLIFHAGLRGLGSNNFRNSSYKETTAGSTCVSRLSFHFLWLWFHNLMMMHAKWLMCHAINQGIGTIKTFTKYKKCYCWLRSPWWQNKI